MRRLARLAAARRFHAAFEFYAEVLGRGAAAGERMLARLGPDAADPIEEFLGQALAYERGHPPALQGFLHWLAPGDIEVKRDRRAGSATRCAS